jgi:hypothetical protein
MTLTVCDGVDNGFGACSCWQPPDRMEATAINTARIIRKLNRPFNEAAVYQRYLFKGFLTRKQGMPRGQRGLLETMNTTGGRSS